MIFNFKQHINENNKKKYNMDIEERTILFTDVKGSSELWNKNEEKMFKALNKQEELIEKLNKKYNSIIIKSIGDAFMLSFLKLKNAINFGIELQKNLKENPIKIDNYNLKIRIGICGGEVYKKVSKLQGKTFIDYFGKVVNTASRMESKVSDVGGIAFAYKGKINNLNLKNYNIDVVNFKKNCKIGKIRSQRLLTDIHKYICKNVKELNGVDETIAYKINL